MIKMTKEQRKALKAVFDRGPITDKALNDKGETYISLLSYRRFRERIFPIFDGSGAIMVYWKGMYVGIEKDGYTHT